MADEQEKSGFWAWVDDNRVIAGAVTGFAAGTIVPGVGNVIGAVVGAGVGYVSSKEKEKTNLEAAYRAEERK